APCSRNRTHMCCTLARMRPTPPRSNTPSSLDLLSCLASIAVTTLSQARTYLAALVALPQSHDPGMLGWRVRGLPGPPFCCFSLGPSSPPLEPTAMPRDLAQL